MSSPWDRYQADLARPDFSADAAQERAVKALQRIHDELRAQPPRRGWPLRRRSQPRWPAVRGAYIWGGVGRGKTYLMDAFFETLPLEHRHRVHFHRFMLDVHRRLRDHPSAADPLAHVAADIAGDVRVLCFDEFFVADVADAMILGRFIGELLAHGVTLVATSNIEPEGLYSGGLQRERFLPAIALLEEHCEIVEVNGDTDYRLRVLNQAEIYHFPLNASADENLSRYFEQLAPDAPHADTTLDINGRDIPVRQVADGIAWFQFDALCRGPRAAADYIEIARQFGTVLLSDVPQMDWTMENEARRFLHLVDEFYDRRVNLIISAAVPMNQLYAGSRLSFEYARVLSRLREMQSTEYLAAAHQP